MERVFVPFGQEGNSWELNENVDYGLQVASGVNSTFEIGTSVGVYQLTKGGKVVSLAEKGAYIGGKTLGKYLGGAGVVLTTGSLIYEWKTGRSNTHSFVDAGVALGTGVAVIAAGILGAPAIAVGAAVVAIGYGVFSVAGGEQWIDNNIGGKDWGKKIIYGDN